jgi:hypothetical protein
MSKKCTDNDFEPFLEKIMRKDGKLPQFEILLRARKLDGSAAHSEIVAFRTHWGLLTTDVFYRGVTEGVRRTGYSEDGGGAAASK